MSFVSIGSWRIMVALVAISACSVAFAADSDKEALVKELLEVTETQKLLDQVKPQMKSIMNSAVPENLPPEKQPIVDKYNKRVIDLVLEEVNWEKLQPQYVDLYMRVFSESELQEMLVFYRSPLGQKMLKKMPELMQESMVMMQKQMQATLPKLQALIKEMKDELCCS